MINGPSLVFDAAMERVEPLVSRTEVLDVRLNLVIRQEV
jgi:hypothetical protein